MKSLNLPLKLIHLRKSYISLTRDLINPFLLPLRNNKLTTTKIYGIRMEANEIYENNKQIQPFDMVYGLEHKILPKLKPITIFPNMQ